MESNNPPSSTWFHPPLWRRRHVPPREEDYVVDTWHVPVTWDRGHQSRGWPDCSEIVYLRVTVVTGEAIRSPATHRQESHYHRCKNEKNSLNVLFATHDTRSWLKIEDEEQQQQRRQHYDLQINRLTATKATTLVALKCSFLRILRYSVTSAPVTSKQQQQQANNNNNNKKHCKVNYFMTFCNCLHACFCFVLLLVLLFCY